MSEKGRALMGTGIGQGEGRAAQAAREAVSSPLLEEEGIRGATGILVNITGGTDLTLQEVNDAIELINEVAHSDCNIIFGSVIDPDLVDQVKITVVATGFDTVRSGRVMDMPAADRRDTGWSQPAPVRSAPTPPEAPAEEPVVVAARQPQPAPQRQAARQQPSVQHGYGNPAPAAHDDQPDYDRPTYERRQGRGDRPTREPKINNPFAPSGESEFDTPTFLRK